MSSTSQYVLLVYWLLEQRTKTGEKVKEEEGERRRRRHGPGERKERGGDRNQGRE